MNNYLTEAIDEKDFLELAQRYSQSFLNIYFFLQNENKAYTRRFYSYLIEESEELESFLDDHGARENKNWFYFSELVACIRNLAKAAFILKHIQSRHLFYSISLDEWGTFNERCHQTSEFFEKAILSLFKEVKNETVNLGIRFLNDSTDDHHFGEVYPQKRLPFTINDIEGLNTRKVIVKIASQYLIVVEKFGNFGWEHIKVKKDDQNEIIPQKINEERSRELISLLHNLQSLFDHNIKRTSLESEDKSLNQFRGYISIVMHLLNITNWLSHFYQRHAHSNKPDGNGFPISDIVEKKELLDIITSFSLFYADKYLLEGKTLAIKILGKYTEIETCKLKIPEKLGFHLRPASLVAKLAQYYGTELVLIVEDKEFNAGNVMSITLAAGLIARKGYKTVVFKGDKRVLKDLKVLSKCNYGEDENGNPIELPPDLAHLWF